MIEKLNILIIHSTGENVDELSMNLASAIDSLQIGTGVKVVEANKASELSNEKFARVLILSQRFKKSLKDEELISLYNQNLALLEIVSVEDSLNPSSQYILSGIDQKSNVRDLKEKFNYLAEILKLRKSLRDLRISSEKNLKMATLGEMNATLAHEINNPLTIILGQIGLMKKFITEEQDPKLLAGFLKIEKTVERITKVVKSLKSFSRDDKNDPPSNIHLSDIINDIFPLCTEMFKKVKIDFQIESKKNPIIRCKEVQIAQVLMNLLQNSFDAVKEQKSPWIKVSSKLENNFVSIYIVDSGEAPSQLTAASIFNPFFTTKSKGEGTGLGLSHSRKVAQEHGGDLILVKNELNTTFELQLPIIS